MKMFVYRPCPAIIVHPNNYTIWHEIEFLKLLISFFLFRRAPEFYTRVLRYSASPFLMGKQKNRGGRVKLQYFDSQASFNGTVAGELSLRDKFSM